jgi:low density lipoprotein-related protein 2
MDGVDEEFCDKLEFNECEEDEYRCANGMCIPGEYWLDGEYDCMDWSDEMRIFVDSGNPCITLPNLDCDEHLCLYDQYSCGDGQCYRQETNRITNLLNIFESSYRSHYSNSIKT